MLVALLNDTILNGGENAIEKMSEKAVMDMRKPPKMVSAYTHRSHHALLGPLVEGVVHL